MRLINESDLIKAIDRHTREDNSLDDDITCILEEVKTVFDKGRVIEEINKYRKNMQSPTSDSCFGEECREDDDCLVCILDKVIEIVEKGGIR